MKLATRILAAVLIASAFATVGCDSGGMKVNRGAHGAAKAKKAPSMDTLLAPLTGGGNKNKASKETATAVAKATTPAKKTRAQKKADREFAKTFAGLTDMARTITGTTGRSPTEKLNSFYKGKLGK